MKPIKIRIDVRLLPLEQVPQNKVGDGREAPNNSPELPKPLGRMTFSLNPFAMLSQLVGPEFRNKVLCSLCMCLMLLLCIGMAPLIASNVASQMITNLIS